MDNTKLVTAESSNAELIEAVREWDTHHRVHPMMRKLADRLEAAEAELTRRDTVIAEVSRLVDGYLGPEVVDVSRARSTSARVLGDIRVALAAAPVSLEAVTAETTTEWGVRWMQVDPPAVTDRGADEVDIRRLVQAFPAVSEAVVREVTEWRPASTEGDNRG